MISSGSDTIMMSCKQR